MTGHREAGIAVADNGEPGDAAARRSDGPPAAVAGTGGEDPGRTDDPMTMYLRDVGGTSILTREGEVALAKRIEAGRRAVQDGLCESMTAIRTVSAWRDAVREGSLALRHVIDVEATYEGDRPDRLGLRGADTAGDAPAHAEADDGDKPRLSAMEEAVRPGVMETLDGIAASWAKLRRLQEKRIELARINRTLTASQTGRRRRLKRELAASMRSLRLTDARAEALVDEMRDAGQRLRRCEGALLRLAVESGVPREAFLKQHEGASSKRAGCPVYAVFAARAGRLWPLRSVPRSWRCAARSWCWRARPRRSLRSSGAPQRRCSAASARRSWPPTR